MKDRDVQENEDYHSANGELFSRLRALEADLAAVRAGDSSTLAPRRARGAMVERWLVREIDAVKAQLVSLNTPLVRKYVGRFSNHASDTQREDFHSAGMVALVEAMRDYDPELGRFSTRAYHPMQRHVITEFRRWTLDHLPASDFERRPAIQHAIRTLARTTGTPPSAEQVAEYTKLPCRQVKRVMDATMNVSLDQPVGDSDVAYSDTLVDKAADMADTIHDEHTYRLLHLFGLAALSERERQVIVRHYGVDGEQCENLADLGKQLGLTREAARQIKARALAKMGHPIVLRKLMLLNAATAGPAA